MKIITLRICLLFLLVQGFHSAWAGKPFCGDNKCNGGETAATCAVDCSVSAVCGDGVCASLESCSSCAADCGACPPAGACNNDGVCNLGEDCSSCPDDCAGIVSGKKSDRYCCGGTTAESLFCDAALCGSDCGTLSLPVCGDGNLDPGEECDDGNTVDGDGCSAACEIETLPVCGDGILDTGEECDDGNLQSGDGCSSTCQNEFVGSLTPANQFNIGDSIGEAEAGDGTVGSKNHESVWSSGYSASDGVNSINERFEATDVDYYENSSTRDGTFNKAISGSVMADFAAQAQQVVNAVADVPSGAAGQVTILLGANDVCADSNAEMTDINQFEAQFRAGLDVLAANEGTRLATIHVSSIPAIYWLWEGRADDSFLSWCKLFAWPNVPCQNLLANSGDDCANLASREDPDNINSGDGPNCQRRKAFHARIRDEYNPALQRVVEEYANRPNNPLLNAEYIDIFGVRFGKQHVNGGDCFHPSFQGHDLLSNEEYCRSSWNGGEVICAQ